MLNFKNEVYVFKTSYNTNKITLSKTAGHFIMYKYIEVIIEIWMLAINIQKLFVVATAYFIIIILFSINARQGDYRVQAACHSP